MKNLLEIRGNKGLFSENIFNFKDINLTLNWGGVPFLAISFAHVEMHVLVQCRVEPAVIAGGTL